MAQCRRHSPSSQAATGMPMLSLAAAPCWIWRIASRREIAPLCTAHQKSYCTCQNAHLQEEITPCHDIMCQLHTPAQMSIVHQPNMLYQDRGVKH